MTSGKTRSLRSVQRARQGGAAQHDLGRPAPTLSLGDGAAGQPSGRSPATPEAAAPAAAAAGGLQLRDHRVRSVEAAEVNAERCAVGRARGGRLRFRQSAVLAALGRDVRLRQSGAAVVAGGKVTVEQGGGQWLIGGRIQAKQVFAVTVVAARVEGQVRCLFDAKGAFAFGAGLALMTTLLRLLVRRR